MMQQIKCIFTCLKLFREMIKAKMGKLAAAIIIPRVPFTYILIKRTLRCKKEFIGGLISSEIMTGLHVKAYTEIGNCSKLFLFRIQNLIISVEWKFEVFSSISKNKNYSADWFSNSDWCYGRKCISHTKRPDYLRKNVVGKTNPCWWLILMVNCIWHA